MGYLGAGSDLPSEEESGPEDAELELGNDSGDDEADSKGRKRATKSKGGSKRYESHFFRTLFVTL